MTISTVAALQIGSSPKAKPARWNTCSHSNPRSSPPAHALVVAEALLGGYPKGEIFGTRLGYRLPEGREAYARYHDNAIDVPGPETEALAGLSRRTGASLVVGVIERGGSTLYCTALYFDPSAGLVAKHRKLMPTGTERLIWGQGDGSTPAGGRHAGRPRRRRHLLGKPHAAAAAMYAKGVQIWCAPPWTSATSGNARCAISPTRPLLRDQRLPGAALARRAGPGRAGLGQPASADQRRLGHHRPLGDVLAGPLHGQTGLLTAASTPPSWSVRATTSMYPGTMPGPTSSA